MRNFYRATTSHPKLIVLLFVLLALFCALCKPLIAVNYDTAIIHPGDYTSVHPLNTEDQIAYENGVVSFHSDAQRVYYQGNLSDRNLPWRFSLTYRLNGQPIEADELAGKSGRVEIDLDVRKNEDVQGDLFRSHALQITVQLDTDKCRNIQAEGATQANVGSNRQLSYIVLPNTEKTIQITTDATDFEMDAISINGVRLSLDIDVDSSDLSEETDKIVDAGVELDDGAQEMKDGTDEFRSETENINDTIREKIDDMIAEKTGSDVQVESFIDPRNTDVENVQFVITTPSVHVSDAPAETAAEETESTGILQKIRDLFR